MANATGRERSNANLRPFQKGQSGNPGGRPRGSVSALWRRLNAEFDESDDREVKRTRGERIYDALYAEAIKGNVHAAALIMNRTEGKPHQSVTLTLDQRDKYERMVDDLIAAEAAENRVITREQAIEALSLAEPLISELLN